MEDIPYPQRPVPARGRRTEVVPREYPVFSGGRGDGFFNPQNQLMKFIIMKRNEGIRWKRKSFT